MNHDNLLIKILSRKGGRFYKNYLNKIKNLPNISKYIYTRFDDCSNSLIEILHRMECHVNHAPKCPICGMPCKYRRYKAGTIIFLKTCGSPKCSKKLMMVNSEKTSLKKYGCKNAGQSKQAKEKRKQTCLNKYGTECTFGSKVIQDKCRQTCLEKYGVTNGGGSKQALEKIRKTNLERRGVPYALLSKECKEKAKQTLFDHYGVHTPLASNKCKEKMIKRNREKYGCDYPMSCDWFKENIKKTCQKKYGVNQVNQFTTSYLWNNYKENTFIKYGYDHVFKVPEIREKIYNTNYDRYGTKTYSQTCMFKDYMFEHINEINEKRDNTKRKNHTYNTSKTEEELYLYIKDKFPLVERQYKCDRYPWKCDFYIPELDCFIEYNGTWTHGKHPYDPNSVEDNIIIKDWKQRYNNGEHPMYLEAIKGWTERDVEKRKCAKIHNLNYYEFWDSKKLKHFIDNL